MGAARHGRMGAFVAVNPWTRMAHKPSQSIRGCDSFGLPHKEQENRPAECENATSGSGSVSSTIMMAKSRRPQNIIRNGHQNTQVEQKKKALNN